MAGPIRIQVGLYSNNLWMPRNWAILFIFKPKYLENSYNLLDWSVKEIESIKMSVDRKL